MGIVYLARDTRLNRTVAIKALPDDVASNPDRLARFRREAQLLASLSHPNIAGIYGLEESGGRRYLALEHVEGETLAERIARVTLPVSETVDICLQIAAGMEAAHEAGIIHRDLKPGNVMITPGDAVKVLDFGLAKGRVANDSGPSPEESPTLTASPTTLPGAILGTAPYLSPEQARGKAVDRRTDIWSFGCVLFECLTGKVAFGGESVSDTIAMILHREPGWALLPVQTPPRITGLLRRCLEKDPKKRLRDIGEAWLVLELAKSGVPATSPEADSIPAGRAARFRVPALAGLAVLSAALGIGVWVNLGPGRAGGRQFHRVARLSVEVPPEIEIVTDNIVAGITPDGRALLLAGRARVKEGDAAAPARLYRRPLDGFRVEPIDGTEGVTAACFTPDGRWLAFTAPISERTTQMRLAKLPVEGNAPPVTVTVLDPSWTDWVMLQSGDVLVNDFDRTHYIRIPRNGGAPSKPISFQVPGFTGTFQIWRTLPADRGILLNTLTYGGGAWQAGVGVLDLKSGKTKILVADGSNPRYAPTGHLLFSRGDALLAVRFALDRLEIQGEPVAITKGLRVPVGWVGAPFDLSQDGILVFAPGGVGGSRRRLVVVDAQGRVSEWSGERQSFSLTPYVSPDGHRAAVTVVNARALLEVWLSERGRPARRLVADPGADCSLPIWSPDGRKIAYTRTSSDGRAGIYVKSLDGGGAPRRIYDTKLRNAKERAISWSPDGSTILFRTFESGNADIFRLAADFKGENPPVAKPVLASSAGELGARFSPDGHWIAFNSDESGKPEIYVAAWGPGGVVGPPIMISVGGDGLPFRWSCDGKRVYYASLQGRMMSVDLQTRPALAASAPVPRWNLAQLKVNTVEWDILPDGSLFAIQKGEEEGDISRFDVVLNFSEELKEHFKAAGRHN